MLRTIAFLVSLLLSSPLVAGSWDAEKDYPTGSNVPYQQGVNYHLEFLPVCRNDAVDWIVRGGRLPSEYFQDMLDAVFKDGKVKIAKGERTFNIIFRHVDPEVATVLPVLDIDHKVIGHISPSKVEPNSLVFTGVYLRDAMAIVTPAEFWSGVNPGFEIHTHFDLEYSPAGARNMQSKKGKVRERLSKGVKATLLILITNC